MTVRVRFAPSPTGYLHIGGARTALYNYLYAKAVGGKFILRVEDTDLERSSSDYEKLQIEDLKWLGLTYDEGPDCPGDVGPYRQSERLDIYKKYAEQLVETGHAHYCFCSEEELDRKREYAEQNNLAPHYDGTCSKLTKEEVAKKRAEGSSAVIRFKAFNKDYTFFDHVRREVSFPAGMVGDFVILRSNGLPVYNYCCVIDDWLMKISHVIRGEDHLGNTLRQLMIYEALGVKPPEFAHLSLLIGNDRQKLSKRHGATSTRHYKDDNFLPVTLKNYLCLLGWSHPEEKDVFNVDDLGTLFTLTRFIRSPAIYDMEKLTWMNGQHLKNLSEEEMVAMIDKVIPADSLYHKQNLDWKRGAVRVFREKISLPQEIIPFVDRLFSVPETTPELEEILAWETTPQIKTYLAEQISAIQKAGTTYVDVATFEKWGEVIKNDLKIKGKPLFMGMRGVLTGEGHGADLKQVIPLTPISVLAKRVGL